MKRKKTNQRQLLFWCLLQIHREHRAKNEEVPFTPLWRLMGDHRIEPLGEWCFMSYEVSTTMSKLKVDEPNLFQSKDWKNRNGSTSLAYRINPNIKPEDIRTEEIRTFYQRTKPKPKPL